MYFPYVRHGVQDTLISQTTGDAPFESDFAVLLSLKRAVFLYHSARVKWHGLIFKRYRLQKSARRVRGGQDLSGHYTSGSDHGRRHLVL